jgi:hypothetical protein
VGNTDAGFILGTGKLLIKVPPTMRFVLDGEMPEYLLAKDLILQVIGERRPAWTCSMIRLRPWWCVLGPAATFKRPRLGVFANKQTNKTAMHQP